MLGYFNAEVCPVLLWRAKQYERVTAKQLADSMRVEQLPYDEIPDRLWPAVRAFRKYRSDAREHVARRLLAELTAPGVSRATS